MGAPPVQRAKEGGATQNHRANDPQQGQDRPPDHRGRKREAGGVKGYKMGEQNGFKALGKGGERGGGAPNPKGFGGNFNNHPDEEEGAAGRGHTREGGGSWVETTATTGRPRPFGNG